MRKKQEQLKKLRRKGNNYVKDGNFDKALEVFLEALKLEYNNESILKNLADLYFQLKIIKKQNVILKLY